MKRLLKGLFLTFALLLSVSSVSAEGIVISPPKFEFALDPGAMVDSVIKVTNQSDKVLELNSEVQDFVSQGETGRPSFVKPEENNTGSSLANWILVNNGEKVVVNPGEKAEIPFLISIPKDAEPGGKYGTIFFYPPVEGTQLNVMQRIGTLILVKVSGEVKESGDLSVFGAYDEEILGEQLESSSETSFYEYLPVNFSVRFQNTGNVHIKPEGKIEIFNIFGKKLEDVAVKSVLSPTGIEIKKEIVDHIPVNNGRGNVLAKSFRKFDSAWKGFPYWTNDENGKRVLEYKDFAMGYYTAKLTLNGAKGEEITEETSFVVLPWKEIFGTILGLVVLVFGFKKYRTWSRKRLEEEIRKQLAKEKK